MNILKSIGIEFDKVPLTLTLSEKNQNHVKTIHAGALFILAESASGAYLSSLFPELKDKVIPLLRGSNIKYKKGAMGVISSHVKLKDDEKERFQKQFSKKSRATIEVKVTLKNESDEIVAEGTFNWYVQQLV